MTLRHAAVRLHGPGQATITVDGQELHGVRAFKMGAAIDEQGLLILDVMVQTGEIDGEMIVVVPQGTAATLVALGWTPPPEQPLGEADDAEGG